MEFKDFVDYLMGVLRVRVSTLRIKGQDREIELQIDKTVTGMDSKGCLVTGQETRLCMLECGHSTADIENIRQCWICGKFGCSSCINKCLITEIWVCSSLECSRWYQIKTDKGTVIFRVSHEGYKILMDWEKKEKIKQFFLSLIQGKKREDKDVQKKS